MSRTCGEAVEINASTNEAVAKSVHRQADVLRQMLRQATTPTTEPVPNNSLGVRSCL